MFRSTASILGEERNVKKHQVFLLVLVIASLGIVLSGCVNVVPPPQAPNYLYPSNGQTNVPINATLSWSDSGSHLTYDVYFGTSPDSSLVKSGLASASYTPGTLSYSTTYYWKIVAKNNIGGVATGGVWSFTTIGSMSVVGKWNLTTNGTPTSGQVYSSPAMSSSGVVFIGNQQGLYSLESDGMYYFKSESPVWSAPVVDSVNNVVFVGNNKGQLLYSYSPFSHLGTVQVSGYPIVSAPLLYNGNVYAVDHAGNIYKMSESSMSPHKMGNIGGNIWSSPVANGTDMFIGSDNGTFYAVNLSDGNVDWHYQLGNPIYGTAAIDSSGNVYIGGTKLWSFTSTGGMRWSKQLDGTRIYGSPVISENGVVYIGTVNGDFYAVDSHTGDILWQKNLSTSIGGISSSAIIGDNGVVYVASGWILYALEAGTGNVLSHVGLGYNVESSPVMNGGYIYIGCDDGYLYQIEALSSTIAQNGWPMFMSNWYHSGMAW